MSVLQKSARRRHYLLCLPTYFDVCYSINPWMDPTRETSADRALSQWKWLHDQLIELGHTVERIEPGPGLPDMVFAANGAIVADGKALVARFRYEQRAEESPAYLEWFGARGYTEVRQSAAINEGEGDYLQVGGRILAGQGFRSEPASQAEVAEFFGAEVQGLTLVDPRFYHLDTALGVLDDTQVMYFPGAFSAQSREVLEHLHPDAVLVAEDEAELFALNAVSDGAHVLIPSRAKRLAAQLRERGYEPIGIEMNELLKAGGGAKCCVLELRGAPQPT